MNKLICREYRFKCYLNANHYIMINGKEGQVHPHTWEFMINILIDNSQFVQFDSFEKALDQYFNRYQNQVLNEMAPFDEMNPTLENMSEYFASDIRDIIREQGGEMMRMESSETPTRSYVIRFEKDFEFIENMQKNTEKKMGEIIDSVLDNIID